MPSLWSVAVFWGVIHLSECSDSCTQTDMKVVSGSSDFIENILSCAAKAGGASGTISTCMSDVYHQFSSVSHSCLKCTKSVLETDIGITCLPKCINDATASDCQECSPDLLLKFRDDCILTLSVTPSSDATTSGGEVATVPYDGSICNSNDLMHIMNGGGMNSLMSSDVIQCASIQLMGSHSDNASECVHLSASLSTLSSDCQQCALNILSNSTNCISPCDQTSTCSSCSNTIATTFSSQCIISTLQSTKSSLVKAKSAWLTLLIVALGILIHL